MLFYVEESPVNEFTNISLIKDLIKKSEINYNTTSPIKEDKNIHNNNIIQKVSNQNLFESSKVTYSVNKKQIVEDILDDNIPNKQGGMNETASKTFVNFNIIINGSNNDDIRKEVVKNSNENLVKQSSFDDQRNKSFNILKVKKRIKKAKKTINSNYRLNIPIFHEIDNEGVREFFSFLKSSNDIKSNDNTNTKYMMSFIRIYFKGIMNEKNQKFIEFILNNESYFHSLFNDLYLIISGYLKENWKWIEKKDHQVTFRAFFLILSQQINQEFLINFCKDQINNHVDQNMLTIEKIREILIENTIKYLKSSQKIEQNLKKELYNDRNLIIPSSHEIDEKFEIIIKKIQNKFLGYKYLLKNLKDL